MHLKNDFPQLDGLRGIAALSVFAHHLFEQFRGAEANPFWSHLLLHLGVWGVAVFFALSGFCIHCSTILQTEKARSFDRHEYFRRRFLRIYPALIVCLIVCFAAERYRSSSLLPDSPLDAVFGHLFLVSGFVPSMRSSVNNVLWSVVLEVHFYLLYGLLWRSFSNLATAGKVTVWAIAVAAITYLISVTFLPSGPSRVTLQHTFLATFWTWCLGAIIAEVIKDYGRPKHRRIAAAALPSIWLATLALAFLPAWYVLQSQRFVLPVLITLGLYLLLVVNTPQLPWRLLKPIGRSSYSLYLFHPLAIWLVLDIPVPMWAKIPLALSAGLLLSALGYKFIEAPFMRFRRTPRVIPAPS